MKDSAENPGSVWRRATVVEVVVETRHAVSVVLEVPWDAPHRPGQSVELAFDDSDRPGSRCVCSIASAPGDGYLTVTLAARPESQAWRLRPADEIDVRGPFGDFTWLEPAPARVMMIAGGLGIVPIRSMLRHALMADDPPCLRLLYSAPRLDEVIYLDELLRIAAFDEVDIRLALTRGWPAAWGGYRGRIDQTTLADASWTPDDRPLIYVSGSASFNDAMRDRLTSMGHHPSRVRVTGDPGS